MHVGTATYSLAGGDAAIVKAGETVHVTGYQAPSSTSTCTQGIRFQVTQADTVRTLAGTVTVGLAKCLALTSGGVTYQLTGGDPAVVKAGAKLTVTGFTVSGVSECQQGTLFRVLSAVPAKQISLRAHANSKYVTAESAGAAPLIANRTAIGPWEEFDSITD
jgi:hypothetical protein